MHLIDERDRLIRPSRSLYAKVISQEKKNEFLVRLNEINGVK